MDEPEIVSDWRRALRAMETEMIPRCCFTCHHWKGERCLEHDAEPPLEFAQSVDSCETWMSELEPF